MKPLCFALPALLLSLCSNVLGQQVAVSGQNHVDNALRTAADYQDYGLAFSPSGRLALIAKQNGELHVIKAATGEVVQKIVGYQSDGPILGAFRTEKSVLTCSLAKVALAGIDLADNAPPAARLLNRVLAGKPKISEWSIEPGDRGGEEIRSWQLETGTLVEDMVYLNDSQQLLVAFRSNTLLQLFAINLQDGSNFSIPIGSPSTSLWNPLRISVTDTQNIFVASDQNLYRIDLLARKALQVAKLPQDTDENIPLFDLSIAANVFGNVVIETRTRIPQQQKLKNAQAQAQANKMRIVGGNEEAFKKSQAPYLERGFFEAADRVQKSLDRINAPEEVDPLDVQLEKLYEQYGRGGLSDEEGHNLFKQIETTKQRRLQQQMAHLPGAQDVIDQITKYVAQVWTYRNKRPQLLWEGAGQLDGDANEAFLSRPRIPGMRLFYLSPEQVAISLKNPRRTVVVNQEDGNIHATWEGIRADVIDTGRRQILCGGAVLKYDLDLKLESNESTTGVKQPVARRTTAEGALATPSSIPSKKESNTQQKVAGVLESGQIVLDHYKDRTLAFNAKGFQILENGKVRDQIYTTKEIDPEYEIHGCLGDHGLHAIGVGKKYGTWTFVLWNETTNSFSRVDASGFRGVAADIARNAGENTFSVFSVGIDYSLSISTLSPNTLKLQHTAAVSPPQAALGPDYGPDQEGFGAIYEPCVSVHRSDQRLHRGFCSINAGRFLWTYDTTREKLELKQLNKSETLGNTACFLQSRGGLYCVIPAYVTNAMQDWLTPAIGQQQSRNEFQLSMLFFDQAGRIVRSIPVKAPITPAAGNNGYTGMVSSVRALAGGSTISLTIQDDPRPLLLDLRNGYAQFDPTPNAIRASTAETRVKAPLPAIRGSDSNRRLYFLGVGTSDYQDQSLSLAYAANDVEAIGKKITVALSDSVSDTFVSMLLNQQTDDQQVLRHLQGIRKCARAEDTVVISVAGHGTVGERGLYLMVHNSDKAQLQGTAVNWSDLAKEINQIRAERIVLLLDVCHAGAFGLSIRELQDGIARLIQEKQGLVVWSACRPDQQSEEHSTLEHGTFTAGLLNLTPQELTRLPLAKLESLVQGFVEEATQQRQTPDMAIRNLPANASLFTAAKLPSESPELETGENEPKVEQSRPRLPQALWVRNGRVGQSVVVSDSGQASSHRFERNGGAATAVITRNLATGEEKLEAIPATPNELSPEPNLSVDGDRLIVSEFDTKTRRFWMRHLDAYSGKKTGEKNWSLGGIRQLDDRGTGNVGTLVRALTNGLPRLELYVFSESNMSHQTTIYKDVGLQDVMGGGQTVWRLGPGERKLVVAMNSQLKVFPIGAQKTQQFPNAGRLIMNLTDGETKLDFDASGQHLLVASVQEPNVEVRVFRTENWNVVGSCAFQSQKDSFIRSIQLSANGQTFIVDQGAEIQLRAVKDGKILLQKAAKKPMLAFFGGGATELECVLSPTKSLFAIAEGKKISVYRQNGEEVCNFQNGQFDVYRMALSAEGSHLVAIDASSERAALWQITANH